MSNPTYGYLASITPSAKTKEVLHVADAGNLVEGKLLISHKDPYPVRVRVGVSTGNITTFDPSNYIIYDWIIEEGRSYESADIYYANNQSLIVYSDSPNTSFIIQGIMVPDPTPSGFVGSVKASPAKKNKVVYTVPTGQAAAVSVFITNQSASNARFRLGISSENAGENLTSDEYIEYNQDLAPRDTYQKTAIKVRGDQSFVVYSDNPDLAISAYAKFNYTQISTDLSLAGDLTLGGNATLGGDIDVTGTTSLNGLTTLNNGVCITGDVDIKGVVRCLDNSDNQKYSFSNDTGTLSTSGSISAVSGLSTGGTLAVGANKFTVDAATGDTNIAGDLTHSGGFTSDINLLNNKVTNLAEPTELTDAVTRRYVDAKIAAFSIALG